MSFRATIRFQTRVIKRSFNEGPTMSILLLVNLKGGVAKTTNAVAMAECFAAEGYRTLLIDADHQCMAGEMVLGGGSAVASRS